MYELIGDFGDMLIMRRPWGADIEISEDWNVPFSITKKGAYFYWTHPELYPCDEMGFRKPFGFVSLAEKYACSEGLTRIFCIGGSTTFGLFNSYENSYPACLESVLSNSSVFNFGLCGMDSTGSMHVLLDTLRSGFKPDLVIFLDGINEKQGWMQAAEGNDVYEEIGWQYRYLHEILYNDNVPMTMKWKKKVTGSGGAGNSQKNVEKKPVNSDSLRFVSAQADSYAKTHQAIQMLSKAWEFRPLFFLEPTVWDIWSGDYDLHFDYIKQLYREIVDKNSDVIDLSPVVALSASNFIEWKHLDAKGNALLASAVAEII